MTSLKAQSRVHACVQLFHKMCEKGLSLRLDQREKQHQILCLRAWEALERFKAGSCTIH